MNRTKIEWTTYTWNPVTGCLKDCWYCYVRRLEEKYGYSRLPQFHADRLSAPRHARPGSRILVCSTADLFAPWIDASWITAVWCEVQRFPEVTFQFLTKFPERYVRWEWPANCWLGTTVESPEHVGRIDSLAGLPNLHFVSFEPLLGDVAAVLGPDRSVRLDWMIIGAITGTRGGAHLPHRNWITGLLDVAAQWCIPVFQKDNLRRLWSGPLRQEFPDPIYLGPKQTMEGAGLCVKPRAISALQQEGEHGQVFE